MKLLIVLCSVVGLALGGALPRDIFTGWEGRIVGGSNANSGQFPYQASYRTAGNAHFCGGWVHNSRWSVCAAHCTIGRTTANTIIVVGTHLRLSGGTQHPLTRLVNHPDYNGNTLANDISLVETTNEIVFNELVQPIALGTEHIGGGVTAIASGWGQTTHPGSAPDNLQWLAVQTLTNEECIERHTAGNRPFVFPNTICTFTQAGQGMCMGDSGGPLAAGGTVIGAVSWGIACAQGFPDVFARVSSHASWLNTIVNS